MIKQKQEDKTLLSVFSMRLAGELMAKGYKLMRMSEHETRPGFYVYYFYPSDEIRAEIAKYSKRSRR